MTTRLQLGPFHIVVEAVCGVSDVIVTIDTVGEDRDLVNTPRDCSFVLSDLGCYEFAKALLLESAEGAHNQKTKSRKKKA